MIFTRYNNFPDIFNTVFFSILLQTKILVSECQICLAVIVKRAKGKAPNTAGFYVSFAFLDLTAKGTVNKKILTWASFLAYIPGILFSPDLGR